MTNTKKFFLNILLSKISLIKFCEKINFSFISSLFCKKCLNNFLPSVEAPEGNNALCDENRGTAVNQDLNLKFPAELKLTELTFNIDI